MKATPIALYLEQKGRAGTVELPARRQPWPFKPKAAAGNASAAPEADDEERAPGAPGLPRVGLFAAVASRVSDAAERSLGARGDAE